MRSKRALSGIAAVVIAFAAVQACGTDPDTPTPTRKQYPEDEIDRVRPNARVIVPQLREPVRVIRDKRGMVHIYARNLHDAAAAEGYMMARDRAPQLELLRRVAEGRLAEVLGNLQPSLVVRDITMRAMGLRRYAEKAYAAMKDGSDEKEMLTGFSAGVTQFYSELRTRRAKQIPSGWSVIPLTGYTDWDPIATLSIGRLQSWALSYTGDSELELTETLERAHATFRADATDPALRARAGFAPDAVRFEPAAKRPVIDAPPKASPSAKDGGSTTAAALPARIAHLMPSVRPALDAIRETRDMLGRGGWSSNSWVVGPSRSASGQVLVASDPHLGLPAPSVFYMMALHVLSGDPTKRLDVGGVSFAGIPGAILGFNKDIAWGATVAGFDVTDAYRDVIRDGRVTLKSPDGAGKTVAVERLTEELNTGTGKISIVLEQIPEHGVVLPTFEGDKWVERKGDQAIAMRWTGMSEPSELGAFVSLARAKNVDEAVAAFASFQVGAQNFVFGDTSGHIRYTTHSHVPVRPREAFGFDPKTMKGRLPCLVLPGDEGLEWSGRVADDQLPAARDPANGYIATANSDQYGLVFDNDPSNGPLYLACTFDPGYRQQRLRQRLDEKDKLTLEDLASIQADARSPLGARIGPFFLRALERAESTRIAPDKPNDLSAVVRDPRYDVARIQFVTALLRSWRDRADFDTPAAVPIGADPVPGSDEVAASQATLVFNAALVALHNRVLDDEWTAMGKPPWSRDFRVKALLRMLEKPEKLATDDGSGESVLWDDLTTKDALETRDQQLVLALLDGLDWIRKTYGENPDKWRWGAAHHVVFKSLLGGTEKELSIPDFTTGFPATGYPRHGDDQVLDRSDYGAGATNGGFEFSYRNGPAQRFVALMKRDALEVRNALPGGNVWRPGDPWFGNEAELWRKNRNAKVAFTPGEVVPEAAERWDLEPF